MTFPTMTSTWKFSSVGLTNVIPLPEGGGPYVIGMDKASGAYTAQLFWSPNLDASPLDDSWLPLSDLDTVDEVAIAFDNDTVRAVMGSITVRPTPVLDKGIFAPVAKLEISVTPANSLGANVKQRHGSGYGSNLIGGSAPVQDEYADLILADMGVSVGSFFEMQDRIVSPLTDTGPAGITDLIDASGPVLVAGPWEGSRGRGGTNNVEYTTTNFDSNSNIDEYFAMEIWARLDDLTNSTILLQWEVGGDTVNTLNIDSAANGSKLEVPCQSFGGLADPGAWAPSTAYVLGDRRRAVVNNNRVAVCTVAGTSATCEPTWPTDGTTVADGGTLVWTDAGTAGSFHDMTGANPSTNGTLSQLQTTTSVVAGEWFHVVFLRTSQAWQLYFNGVLEAEHDLDVIVGGRGNSVPDRTERDYNGTDIFVMAGPGGSEPMTGAVAYLAHYEGDAILTPAQILAHYDKGVELGLN